MSTKRELSIGCVVMAAGLSSRFGRNKLLAEFRGRSLLSRALDAVPVERLSKVVVVTSCPEIRAQAETGGWTTVWNDRPEDGISLTIRLGLQAIRDTDAAVFMVCDQPKLTRASVSAMVDCYLDNPDRIVSLACGDARGNPCVFPSAFYPELCALTGDTGGITVISRHEDALLLFEITDASELMDIDTVSDLYDV